MKRTDIAWCDVMLIISTAMMILTMGKVNDKIPLTRKSTRFLCITKATTQKLVRLGEEGPVIEVELPRGPRGPCPFSFEISKPLLFFIQYACMWERRGDREDKKGRNKMEKKNREGQGREALDRWRNSNRCKNETGKRVKNWEIYLKKNRSREKLRQCKYERKIGLGKSIHLYNNRNHNQNPCRCPHVL